MNQVDRLDTVREEVSERVCVSQRLSALVMVHCRLLEFLQYQYCSSRKFLVFWFESGRELIIFGLRRQLHKILL